MNWPPVSTLRPLNRLKRLLCLAISLCWIGPFAGSALAAQEPLEVAPGSTVRWIALGTQTCHLRGAAGDDRSWPAKKGICYIPIDLTRTGTIEAMRTFPDGRYERLTLRVGDYPYPEQHIKLQDDSRVNLSDANAARAGRERKLIDALWPRETASQFELPLHPPLAQLPEGGRFGTRRVFNGQPRGPHTGRDYSVPRGTPVLATANGRVELAGDHFFGGKSIFIDHGEGLISMYFHLDSIDVEQGQLVERGKPIGKVGSTGRSTGPHLHFGLRWHGARVDPAPLMADPEKLTSAR